MPSDAQAKPERGISVSSRWGWGPGASAKMMKQLVVVGNGMAGVACVEQVLKHAPRFEITIFGDETHVNYNRIMLS